MQEENILLNIEFNSDVIKNAVKEIVSGRQAIDSLIESNKKLEAQGLKNSAAYVKNQESIKSLNAEVSTNSKVIQSNTQAVKANEDSLKSLKEQNKQLLKDRDLISTATAEGRAQIEKLNAKYDENSKIIAANSTQVEKQRFNIGNYSSALDNVVPGLGKFATGLDAAATSQKGLTTGAKAFIATGIGLVIAAVGLALGALIAYFKGSEEGQDRLNKIMAIGSAILEQFTNLAEAAGEAIFNAIENPQQAIKNFGNLIKENITNRFEGMMELIPAIGKAINLLFEGEFSEAGKVAFDAVAKVGLGIEDASGKIKGFIDSTGALVQAGIDNGTKLAGLQAKIDKDERALITEREKVRLEVLKKRTEAVELEGDARKKAIEEAIALEEGLTAKEVALAQARRERAALSVEANGNDKDALDDLAQAQAAVIQAEASAFENTLKFRKELQSLNEGEAKAAADAEKEKADAAAKAQEDAIKAEEARVQLEQEQLKTAQEFEKELLATKLADYEEYVQGLINAKKEELLAGVISQEEYNQEVADLEEAGLETQLALKEQFGEEDLALAGRITDGKIAQKTFEAEQAEALEKRKLDAVGNTLGQVAGLFNKNSIAFKALATAQTLIQTYQSAQAVFTGMTSTIPGPVGIALGIAGAAAAVISGLGNVAKINATKVPKLEQGGLIEIGGRRHSQGGEDVHVGGKLVANVEQGENMVVLKRGTSPLLRNLSNINMLAGGRDFYGDRSARFHNADGGFVARAAGSQVSSFQNLSIAEDLKKIKIFTSVTDLDRLREQMNRANFTSELS